MEKEVLKCIDEINRTAILFTIKKYHKKFIKTKYFDDLFYIAYIAILNERKNNPQKEFTINDLIHIASKAIRKVIYNIDKENEYIQMSINDNINNKSNTNNLTLEKSLTDNREPSEQVIYYDLEIAVKEYIKQNYKIKEQNILIDFIFNGYKNTEIMQKYNLTNQSILCRIMREFRQNINKYLLEKCLIEKEIEFNKFNKNYESNKFRYKKNKLKKQGVLIYNFDLLIYKLCREYSSKDELIKVLNIDKNHFEKIINRSKNAGKLFLYQIEKLKKNIFKNYNFLDLIKAVQYA